MSAKGNDGKAITIYDIAKEAGVSASTVSRVLTNSAKVRPEKKQKVQELIDKYNFKPNVLAKGLANTKSNTIGILAADIRNPYYADLCVALEQAARQKDYTVVVCNSLGNYETEKELLETLQRQKVDAIIQLGGQVDKLSSGEDYVELANTVMASVPMVITGKLDGTRAHAVRIDSMAAMDLLMKHLLELGHTRIALIGGRKNVLATFEKYQRYKLVLKENMIEFDPDLVSEDSGYDFEGGYQRMAQMLDKGINPTAVIAINDFAAMGILKCCNERNIKVPEDISVVSYDNTYIAQLTTPRLTSIDYNFVEYGKKLIDTAISLIDGQKVGNVRMVTPTLVVRESSGKNTK